MFKKYLELLRKGLSEEDAITIVKGLNPEATEDEHAEVLASCKKLIEDEKREQAVILEKTLTSKATKQAEGDDEDDSDEGEEEDEGEKAVTRKEFNAMLKSIRMNIEEKKDVDPEDTESLFGKYLQLTYKQSKNLISFAQYQELSKGLIASKKQLEREGIDKKTLAEDSTTSYGNTIVPTLAREIAKRAFMKHRLLEKINVKTASYLTQVDSIGRVEMENLATNNSAQTERTLTTSKQDISFKKSAINVYIDNSALLDPLAQRDLGEIVIERMTDAKIRNLVPQIISGKEGEDGLNSNSTDDHFDGIFAQAGITQDLIQTSTDQPLTTDDLQEAMMSSIGEEFQDGMLCAVVDRATSYNLVQEKDNEGRYTDRAKVGMDGILRTYGMEIIATDLMKRTWNNRSSSLGGTNLPLFIGDLSKFYYADRAMRTKFFDQTRANTDETQVQMIYEYKWLIPTGFNNAFVAFLNCVAPS